MYLYINVCAETLITPHTVILAMGKAIDEKVQDVKVGKNTLIDTVIDTVYARGARGYSISDKVLDTDVVKVLMREIEKTDENRKELKDETEYRLDRVKDFLHGSKEFKQKVVALAKEKDITFEEANEELSGK